MARIFLSYAREDAAIASVIARMLGRAGHTVWWDRHVGGGARFAKEIASALRDAEAVIVLWSHHAIDSSWVLDEAAEGRDDGRLVPVSIDRIQPPLGFRQFQSVDFAGWRGRRNSAAFKGLERAIASAVTGERRIEEQTRPVRRNWPLAAWRSLTAIVILGLLTLALAAWLSGWNPLRKSAQGPIGVAVLPFAAIPPDQSNTPFAEGLAEEISGQLARNPRLQMIGRTSAGMFKDRNVDATTIGRKLGVAYLLDGTVRRAGNQVRVGVELVRSRDGVQLWRHSYNGSINDIFAIQDRIGQSVEGQLRATFVGKEGVSARSLATRGDVYSYYLTARGLLREPGKFTGSRRESIDTAIQLLRTAVTLDPNYAPGWAQLSGAVRNQREVAGGPPDAAADARARKLATAYADRALALAPQLAEAHYAKARTLAGPEGRSAGNLTGLQTAARLDPNSADAWFSLANYYSWDGDFGAELDARRKAVALEPLWLFAFGPATQTAWDLGFEDEAWRYARRIERDGDPLPFFAHMVRGDMASRNGDLSLQLAEGLAAKRTADSGHRYFADFQIGSALRAAGDLDRARPFWVFSRVDEEMIWRLWHGQPPSVRELAALSRKPIYLWGDATISPLLKALVNHGRSAEVVDLYRRRFGTPARLWPYPLEHIHYVEDATTIAIALRDAGISDEANALLALVRQSVDERFRRGRVPRSYFYRASMVAAAQGDDRNALRWLEKADTSKWWYAQEFSLLDIADEPAFRNLRSNPRFQAVAAHQRAWQAKERREMAPLLAQVGKP